MPKHAFDFREFVHLTFFGEMALDPRLRRAAKNFLALVRWEPWINATRLESDYLSSLIDNEHPVILDIGCNDGTQTAWFLDLFQKSRVYSFEPDPRAREKFRAKILDARATLFDVAISDKDGFIDFYASGGIPPTNAEKYPHGWDLSGSIRKPKEHVNAVPWCRFEEPITVKTKRLDTWAAEENITSVDLIWADVQGAEVDLIRGAQETLKKTRFLYTEYNNKELYEGQVNLKQLLRLIPDYRVVCRYEYDVLLKNNVL